MKKAPQRCPWAAKGGPLYERYHDEEWGVPHADSGRLFEKLVLEGFQAGLSWITILRKRESFRRAFDGFNAERIARYGPRDITRLMSDEGIVRNRLKIEATISNAQAYLDLCERTTLAEFLWTQLPDGPILNRFGDMRDIPASTELSKRLSHALKRQGFRFVGPTTVYAFMQSVGMVNDHLVTCPRHRECKTLQRMFELP